MHGRFMRTPLSQIDKWAAISVHNKDKIILSFLSIITYPGSCFNPFMSMISKM